MNVLINSTNMSKVADIQVESLIVLKDKGMSHQALANRFGVSKSTIRRKLRTHETPPEILDFTARLQKLAEEAPNGLCRKELLRAIHHLRTRHGVSRDGRKAQILESISTGAQSVDDIADDLGLNKEETMIYKDELVELLSELIADGKIVKRAPGGIYNRGRKIKYLYFLPV